MEEIWKNIKEYENMYQCSNLGNIRTLDRYVYSKDGSRKHFRKGTLLKTIKNKNGYLQVGLNKNGCRKMKYIHRIVAETFLNNPNYLKVVNHKDGNKTNNKIQNLEWCTLSENSIHACRYLQKNNNKKNQTKKKVKVCIVDTLLNIEKNYESIQKTSDEINLSCTQIQRYLDKNKKWKGRFLFISDRNKCVEDIERVS